MIITRDGKIIQLTPNELQLAYEEYLNSYCRGMIEDAIDRNAENLRFGTDFTMDEFIDECMAELNNDDWIAEQERYDEVVFNTAESNDVWVEDPNEEDEECDCD